MAAREYIIGQIVVLEDLITDPSTGDPDDPSTWDPVNDPTAIVTVYKPDGTTSTPSVTHSGTTPFPSTAQITIDQTSWWEYVWRSTGIGAGARRGRFYVSPVP